MKIHALYDGSGPKYHRILLPLSLMPGVELTFSRDLKEEHCNVDIVLVNRVVMNTNLLTVCELRGKYGFKLIIDNDDYWHLDATHIMSDLYKATKASEIMEAYMLEADAVFVTHERLYEKAKALNRNVHILPNAIPKFGQFTYKKTESDLTRLFWCGSSTHVNDMELLRGPVKRLKGTPGIQMVMGGYNNIPEYLQMASAFTAGGSLPNNLIEPLPVESYYGMYSQCDIALIPLIDNSFNRYKSNLKVLEAANIGAPVIVSNVNPYLDIPYVKYVNSQKDWYQHIKSLLKCPEEAKYMGMKLQEWASEHFNFNKINTERKQIFEHVTGKQSEVREVQVCAE